MEYSAILTLIAKLWIWIATDAAIASGGKCIPLWRYFLGLSRILRAFVFVRQFPFADRDEMWNYAARHVFELLGHLRMAFIVHIHLLADIHIPNVFVFDLVI